MVCVAGLLTGVSGGSAVATQGEAASLASLAQIQIKRQGGDEVQL
jgi:hypothetical protein